VTDVTKDGTLNGPNLELLRDVMERTHRPVIASGGVTNIDDVKRLKTVAADGIIGAITGRAIYEGTINLAEAQALADL